MKSKRTIRIVSSPVHWAEMPWGENYRSALENKLKPWFAKMFGFYMIKVGNLSAEINTESCSISHQINVSLSGKPVQIKADPLCLPFAKKSVDVCLLAQTLPWCRDPHRLLREVDRILIDDGWLILSGFNPLSFVGLRKLLLYRKPPYNSRMFTLTRQIDWLSLLNFEVLYCTNFQLLPWLQSKGRTFSTYLSMLGCMQLIVARKRTIPLTLNSIKQSDTKIHLRPAVGATRQS